MKKSWSITFLIVAQLILALVAIWSVKVLDDQLQEPTSPKYELKRYFDENNELKTGLELAPLDQHD